VSEALAEPLRLFSIRRMSRQVRTDADDHSGSPHPSGPHPLDGLGPRPTKIASPIRKWPMLSSAISGMAATGLTVS
jgi:hypothetical protein